MSLITVTDKAKQALAPYHSPEQPVVTLRFFIECEGG